jgi:hypothetical protein
MSNATFDAQTALAQIGPMRLMAMGARQFVSDAENARVYFRVLGGSSLQKIEVTLDADDTYSVRFLKINRRTGDAAVLREASGIYCDVLGETCYRFTHGLD